MDQLDWRPVMQYVRAARADLPDWHKDETGPGIDDILSRNFNIDISDRRQLYYFLWHMAAAAKALSYIARASADAPNYFDLDKAQADLLVSNILLTWAILALQLEEHLPAEVQSGRKKRERIYGPPIDPAIFKWSTLVPAPEQVERHQAWERAAKMTPGQSAMHDQTGAAVREAAADGFNTYMAAAAQFCIVGLATDHLDPDQVPTEIALRFRDVTVVALYNHIPSEYRKLAEAN